MESLGSRLRARRIEIGLSQTEVAKKIGISYQTIQQVEAGGRTKHIVAIAHAIGVNPEWLEFGTGTKELYLPKESSRPVQPAPLPNQGRDLIRVLGMAECGPDGWSLWNGDVVDMVPRPPNLAGANQAYAVYVTGDSMEPRYYASELAYIHPGKPVTVGAFVLVQIQPKHQGEAPRAVLKRLVRRSASKLVLEQFNPPKQFTIAPSDIVSIHRVVGSGEA